STAGEVSTDFKAALAGRPVSIAQETNRLPVANAGAVAPPGTPAGGTVVGTPEKGTAVPTQGKATKAPQPTPVFSSQAPPRRNTRLLVGIIAVAIVALLILSAVTIIAVITGQNTPTAVAAAPSVTLAALPTNLPPSALPVTATPNQDLTSTTNAGQTQTALA